ncbi:exonuclease SbcCD subunit D [Sulfolobus sp. S-194]|uniref:DNA double-strand break repair protein Mre11 n=1 Tax=Sulfolobus sp. S-194 TaxID=2512240 RepID=UPI001436DF97|nr:DNA double-strand break repair protein Mre11 [Sulfolobus sp. S-194]QIW24902.1 exonuclease SbcCD subunit D [Sulfolobus sp. S-194]
MSKTQILHISDTHLGKRQYNLDFREQDVYDTFSQLIDIAIKEHVDGIIHTGDLFDINDPPNKAEIVAIRELKRLKEAGIPFIVIAGDHDSPKKFTSIYPQKILEEFDLIKFLSKPDTPYKLGDIAIYGISHVPNVAKERLKELLSRLKPENKKSILLLHQGLKEVLPYEGAWQIQIDDLPKAFPYYALGHFHTRRVFQLDGGRIIEIAGSPDILREEEIDGYEKEGKGATLIDFSGDIPSIQKINIDVRKQYVVTLNTNNLKEEIRKLREKYDTKNEKKPIFHIILEGKSIPKNILMKELQEINNFAPYWRIYKDNTKEKDEKDVKIDLPTDTTIENLIYNYLVKIANFSEIEARIIVDIINRADEREYVKEELTKMIGVENDNKKN